MWIIVQLQCISDGTWKTILGEWIVNNMEKYYIYYLSFVTESIYDEYLDEKIYVKASSKLQQWVYEKG